MPRSSMSWETFERVCTDLSKHLDEIKTVVLYHGGEPLLNKRFVEMVRRLKQLGVPTVKTVSNGMLLTDAHIKGLVSSGLDMIECSLDGQSAEENNFIRRNCDAATVLTNVKRLLTHRRAVGATTPQVFISSTQFLTPESHVAKDQPAPAPAYVVDALSGEFSGEIAGYKTTWAMRWPHMEVLDDVYDLYQDPYSTGELNYCDLVDFTITVRWNGDVVSCCYDLTSRYVLGNVLKEDLASIWNGKRYLGLRRSIDTKKFIPLCASCNKVKPNVYLLEKPEVRARFLQPAPASGSATAAGPEEAS